MNCETTQIYAVRKLRQMHVPAKWYPVFGRLNPIVQLLPQLARSGHWAFVPNAAIGGCPQRYVDYN